MHGEVRTGFLVGIVDLFALQRSTLHVDTAFKAAGDRHTHDLPCLNELPHTAHAVVVHDSGSAQSGFPRVKYGGCRRIRRERVTGVNVIVDENTGFGPLNFRGMDSDHTERFQTFGSGNVCPADGCYMHLQIHFVVPTFHWKPLWHNSLEAAGMNTSYSEGY